MLRPGELIIAQNAPAAGCTLGEARKYTAWLATHHYENFHVVSWMLPRELHQHFYNVYAYCRWADDLGDEIPDRARALALLDWWEQELNQCYAGNPSHPVFVALRDTILAKNIPIAPFANLLRAFRQDQTVKRYPTWESVLDYCRYSANPVGRLVLYLCGYSDEERMELSDATCTALQLANFWQDVSRDLEKGRIYVPLDVAEKHGVSEREIEERNFNPRFASLMRELIGRTRELFAQGMKLVDRVDARLRVDLEMFNAGGLAVLDSIEAIGFDTLHHRPTISRRRQAGLFARALWSRLVPHKPAAAHQPASPGNISVSDSYRECRRVARSSGSNFYYAFYLLPPEKRDALAALYAFMRIADDLADEGTDLTAKQRGLAEWRAKMDAALTEENAVASPVLPALAHAVRRFGIPARYLHDLISGAEMDLTVREYPTFERLREYCYRVAGTVGLTCTHVFGFRDPVALELAEKLGIALQLTNIIRDVRADYQLGRIYLPEKDRARYGVTPGDLGRETESLGVRELLRFEAARAWEFYEEGAKLVSLVEPYSRPALWLLVRTYTALLAAMEERDFSVFGERVRLSKAEKLYLVAVARFGELTEKNVLEKRHRDRRRAGGIGRERRAG